MPTATICFPDSPHYRRDAFAAGLAQHGFRSRFAWPPRSTASPKPDDVLLVWNRQPATLQLAAEHEAAGARIIVVENGYIGRDGAGAQLFAIARGQHNGAGYWFHGDGDRLTDLGLELAPWREDGEHILVLPQRSIGLPGVRMEHGWTEDVVQRLEAMRLGREIRVRRHPGKDRDQVALAPDLAGAWCAVTWGSGAGIKAIVAGIPVFHEFPRWIGAPAARLGVAEINRPFLGDRLPMLHRLTWAQWRAAEIEAGEPFRWLLL